MSYRLLQLFELPLQHEAATQKVITATASLVHPYMWDVFIAYFSEIRWKTHDKFPPFRWHGELIFFYDFLFANVFYFAWTTKQQIVLEKHSLSIPLVDAGIMDSQNHSGNGCLT